MKFFTLVYTVFILFLALKPAVDFLVEQPARAKICCSVKQWNVISDCDKSQEPYKSTDCDDNSCNPFQVCSSCVLVCLGWPFEDIKKPTADLDMEFGYKSVFIFQFSSDFWHPPKIV